MMVEERVECPPEAPGTDKPAPRNRRDGQDKDRRRDDAGRRGIQRCMLIGVVVEENSNRLPAHASAAYTGLFHRIAWTWC